MSLQRLLMLGFVLISIIATATLAIALYVNTESALREAALRQLESIASIQQQRVQALLSKRRERLVLVSSRTQMRLSLAAWVKDGDPVHVKKITRIIRDALGSIGDFQQIIVAATDGSVVAATDHSRIGSSISSAPIFSRARTAIVVDELRKAPNGELLSVLGGPLTLDGQPIGVIIIESSAQDLIDIVTNYTGLGETGETLIGRRDAQGDALMLTPLRFEPHAAMQRVVAASQQEAPMNAALAGKEQPHIDVTNYRDRKVLAISRFLTNPAWGIVVEMESAEAYAPLQKNAKTFWQILLAVLLIALLLGWLTSHAIARSLQQSIDVINRIARGEKGRRALPLVANRVPAIQQTLDIARSVDNMAATLEEREDQLRAAQAQITRTERMAGIGEAVAGIAHEIGNPLGVIITAASTLLERGNQIAEQLATGKLSKSGLTQYLEVTNKSAELIQSNSNRAAQLMRSYKTVTVDQASDAPRKINLYDYIDEILVSIRHTYSNRAVTVDVKGEPDLLINCKPGAIAQILSNLVQNSLIHGFPENGGGEITIELTRQGDSVRITYRDDGVGLTPLVKERFFERFFTTRRDRGGSGLGMFIVQQLVREDLNGEIAVLSEPGAGITFHIDLPIGVPHNAP